MNIDWDNNSLFFTHTFTDETSGFDPLGFWAGDCCLRKYKCRVPVAFKDCPEMIELFVVLMIERPDEVGFWCKSTISKCFADIKAGRIKPIDEVIEHYRRECGHTNID